MSRKRNREKRSPKKSKVQKKQEREQKRTQRRREPKPLPRQKRQEHPLTPQEAQRAWRDLIDTDMKKKREAVFAKQRERVKSVEEWLLEPKSLAAQKEGACVRTS